MPDFMRERILIVDDEAGVRASLSGILSDEGYRVDAVETGEAGVKAVESNRYELALLDVWLPGIDGIETLTRIQAIDPDLPVVVISGHGTVETAVKAVRLGAADFIEKPLSLERILLAVSNSLRRRKLEQEVRALKAEVEHKHQIVGESDAVKELRGVIAQAAPSNGRVLITGENGTGKELVARGIHQQSLRSGGPFVEVNCAAIPEELIESELFGHAKGSFTGATASRKGKFEIADGGTLFLDEIGDMTLKTQAKVLRALQEQKIEPVGGAAGVTVDVRVIAATNKNLEDEIRKGLFRDDLYFRLNVIPIHVVPLRERRTDIPMLVRHFSKGYAVEYGRHVKDYSPEAMEMLSGHDWPGNVRELRNMIERLVIMAKSDVVEVSDLGVLRSPLVPESALTPSAGPAFLEAPASSPSSSNSLSDFETLALAREDFERRYIARKHEACHGNMSRTAESLGVERSYLYKKMKALGLIAPKKTADAAPSDA
jgi:two-component system nitrogen regulation response regulator NtrX